MKGEHEGYMQNLVKTEMNSTGGWISVIQMSVRGEGIVVTELDENDSKKVCPYEPQKDSTTETENQSIEELDEVEKALEVVQNFAVKHWMPCLRDCCGDGLYKVEELKEQLRNEQSND